MNTWNLRTEILSVTHKWYWVVTGFLFGALLGWLVSIAWPAPYRAVQDIYVGLNAHRATRDLYLADVGVEQFRNLDDYKNWQMEELNSLALSDEYLAETLRRLKEADNDLAGVELNGLRDMLAIAWRNTGDWHFSAQSDNPHQAEQAVMIWSQVVTEEVEFAVNAARQMVALDSQIQAVSDELVELETRLILLQETEKALDEWQAYLDAAPADDSLTPLTHWELLRTVSNIADWVPGWQSIINTEPPIGSVPEDYQRWLEQVNALIEAELAIIPLQIDALKSEFESLTVAYRKSSDESRGLSGNIEIGPLKSGMVDVVHLQPTGTLMLIGGVLSLIVMGLIWLVQVTRRTG